MFLIRPFIRAWYYWWDYRRRDHEWARAVIKWDKDGQVGPVPPFPPPTVPNFWGDM